MQHEITNLDLYENQRGTFKMPSETNELISESNLRTFLLQQQRFYSTASILENSDDWELKVSEHSDTESDLSLFAVSVIIQPKELDITEFAETLGEDFFDKILDIASKSNTRNIRGQRACFLSAFEVQQHPSYGEVLAAKLLIGTSVYYNDYRVTVNFPDVFDEDEVEQQIQYIYRALDNWHDDLKVELEVLDL